MRHRPASPSEECVKTRSIQEGMPARGSLTLFLLICPARDVFCRVSSSLCTKGEGTGDDHRDGMSSPTGVFDQVIVDTGISNPINTPCAAACESSGFSFLFFFSFVLKRSRFSLVQ